MLITEIKPGKRKTYYIYAEGEFLFSAYAEILYKYDIKVGANIQKSTLVAAQQEQNIMYAKNKALDILSRAMCSQRMLYDKLIQKGIDSEAAKAAVEYARDLGYVNDAELIKSLTEGLIREKGYGKSRIFSYLYAKGFEPEAIKEAYENAEADKSEGLYKLIAKSNVDLTNKKEALKLCAKLQRRGFGYAQIRAAMKDYIDEE